MYPRGPMVGQWWEMTASALAPWDHPGAPSLIANDRACRTPRRP